MKPTDRKRPADCIFDRVRRRRHFTREDEMLVADALRGIKWFHRQLLLNHGLLVGNAPLSPAQRRLPTFTGVPEPTTLNTDRQRARVDETS